MVSRATDASKIALVHLLARLKSGGYGLLDCQFQTEHLKQFGTIEIEREAYHTRLKSALSLEPDFYDLPARSDGATALKVLGFAH